MRPKLEHLSEEAIVLDKKYDSALIGADSDGMAVYDADAVIRIDAEDGMSYAESAEFHEFNTFGAYMENCPKYIYTFKEE